MGSPRHLCTSRSVMDSKLPCSTILVSKASGRFHQLYKVQGHLASFRSSQLRLSSDSFHSYHLNYPYNNNNNNPRVSLHSDLSQPQTSNRSSRCRTWESLSRQPAYFSQKIHKSTSVGTRATQHSYKPVGSRLWTIRHLLRVTSIFNQTILAQSRRSLIYWSLLQYQHTWSHQRSSQHISHHHLNRKHQQPCVSGRLPRSGASAAAKRSITPPSPAVAALVEVSRIRALQLGKDTATSLAAATLLGLLSRLVFGFPFRAILWVIDN